MNVGKIISGSQLLQRAEYIDYTTPAEERSFEEIKVKQTSETGNQEHSYKEENRFGKEQVKEMVEAMNQFMEPTHSALKFEYHEKLEEYYVTIINSDTKEIIKEIPPKKMLDMYASMAELLGIIVDKKL